jgi:hypothetical protein
MRAGWGTRAGAVADDYCRRRVCRHAGGRRGGLDPCRLLEHHLALAGHVAVPPGTKASMELQLQDELVNNQGSQQAATQQRIVRGGARRRHSPAGPLIQSILHFAASKAAAAEDEGMVAHQEGWCYWRAAPAGRPPTTWGAVTTKSYNKMLTLILPCQGVCVRHASVNGTGQSSVELPLEDLCSTSTDLWPHSD